MTLNSNTICLTSYDKKLKDVWFFCTGKKHDVILTIIYFYHVCTHTLTHTAHTLRTHISTNLVP